MTASKNVRAVKVVRTGDETPAIAQTTVWLILDADTRRPLPWRVIILLPEELAPEPLVFCTRDEARAWAATDSRAREFEWTGLESAGPEFPVGAPFTKRGDSNTMTLYSGYGGGGTAYTVPAQTGVTDWAAQEPSSANVPPWMPRSCSSAGQSDLWGNEYGKPLGEQLLAIRGPHDLDDLPFPEVVSVFTNSD